MKKAYFRFEIDAYTPDTLPLSRFAEYAFDLAELFGHKENVHFVKMDKSSAVPVVAVDYTAVPKVRHRLKQVQRGDPPDDAARAYEKINRRLASDNAVGEIRESRRPKTGVVIFPGRRQLVRETYGPFNQMGSIDGQLIRIGGELDMVPVHLRAEEDRVYLCQIHKSRAPNISPHIFGPTLRVYGEGRWERDEKAQWQMRRFTIDRFEVLKEKPLMEVVEGLRSIEGGLKKIDDPLKELNALRRG